MAPAQRDRAGVSVCAFFLSHTSKEQEPKRTHAAGVMPSSLLELGQLTLLVLPHQGNVQGSEQPWEVFRRAGHRLRCRKRRLRRRVCKSKKRGAGQGGTNGEEEEKERGHLLQQAGAQKRGKLCFFGCW